MDTLGMTMPKAGVQTGVGVWVIAATVAIAGLLATGLLAAVPAGAGLVVAAASDLTTHRFSTHRLGITGGLAAAVLLIDTAVDGTWARLAFAMAATAGVAALLTVTWLVTRGLAFGDVLLVAFTLAIPLYMSVLAAAVTSGVAVLAAAAVVAVRVVRLGPDRPSTIALAPALLVGWLAGVIVG